MATAFAMRNSIRYGVFRPELNGLRHDYRPDMRAPRPLRKKACSSQIMPLIPFSRDRAREEKHCWVREEKRWVREEKRCWEFVKRRLWPSRSQNHPRWQLMAELLPYIREPLDREEGGLQTCWLQLASSKLSNLPTIARRPYMLALRVLRGEFAAEEVERRGCLAGIKKGLHRLSVSIATSLGFDDMQHVYTAFYAACALGLIDAVKWLVIQYNMTGDSIRNYFNLAFRLASAGGHLAILQWLDERFDLCEADARSRGHQALKLASTRGHAAVAVWLVLRYSYSPEELAPHRRNIVKHVYAEGSQVEYSAEVRAVLNKCDEMLDRKEDTIEVFIAKLQL